MMESRDSTTIPYGLFHMDHPFHHHSTWTVPYGPSIPPSFHMDCSTWTIHSTTIPYGLHTFQRYSIFIPHPFHMDSIHLRDIPHPFHIYSTPIPYGLHTFQGYSTFIPIHSISIPHP